MKNILDSSAWIEYFAGTEKGKVVDNALKDRIGTSIIAIAELADKFARENREFDGALNFIRANAAIVDLTVEVSLRAAEIKSVQRKNKPKYSLADAIHYATAEAESCMLLTTDTDFEDQENAIVL